MCVTCDRGYSLDSTGCPFNLRGEHTAGRAGEDSWEVRACFLCRAGSRVNAVCCPSLSFFPFPLSYLISVIIRISCVWKWFSEQMCLRLGNWLSNCAMYVRWQMWARICANGQLIQTSPDICPICQLLCSMENGLVVFFCIAGVSCFGLKRSQVWEIHGRTGSFQTHTFCPQYVAGFLTNFMDTFLGNCVV